MWTCPTHRPFLPSAGSPCRCPSRLPGLLSSRTRAGPREDRTQPSTSRSCWQARRTRRCWRTPLARCRLDKDGPTAGDLEQSFLPLLNAELLARQRPHAQCLTIVAASVTVPGAGVRPARRRITVRHKSICSSPATMTAEQVAPRSCGRCPSAAVSAAVHASSRGARVTRSVSTTRRWPGWPATRSSSNCRRLVIIGTVNLLPTSVA